MGVAVIIGAIGATFAVIAIPMFDRVKIDDPVGALSVHLIAGIWGTLAVGIFGDGSLLTQLIGVSVIGAFTFVSSLVVWKTLQIAMGLRISLDAESQGMDLSEFGLTAYSKVTGSVSLEHRNVELSTV
jgi:Amt family ammonium transporter